MCIRDREYALKNTPFYCLLKIRFYNNDCDMGEQGGLMPVSYTHLDVYKRQGSMCASIY